TEKLSPAGGMAQRSRTRAQEGDPTPEIGMVGVTREQGPTFGIPVGDDVHLGFLATGAEDPVDVGEDAELTVARRTVAQAKALDSNGRATRLVERHEGYELLLDRMAIVLERGVALAVARPVGVKLSNGGRRWSPVHAQMLVANVNSVAGGIAHRI